MSKIKHRSVVQFDNDLVASGSAFFYGNTDMEGSLHVGGAASFSGPSDTFVTFNASDTTPSVSAGNLFKTHASSQTLTMFDDGAAGQWRDGASHGDEAERRSGSSSGRDREILSRCTCRSFLDALFIVQWS